MREGLHALATSRKPGIRALLRVAKVDPGALDARAIGFRLAPRINAAGRLYRADAGLELVLTDDAERAAAIADELDHANAERRHTETRILFEAEAQVREVGEQPAYVLAGEGWHPGVIGIVASRIAERHHRPCVMIALDGDEGTGSGRSIPAFDLLGGLDASAEHLLRHGGHRAAAGCTIARARSTPSAPPSSSTPPRSCARRTSCPPSASTPWSRATSSAWRWPRSSSGWRPSGSAIRRSRCSCRPRGWSTRGRWARRAATCASPWRPAATAPARSPSASAGCPTATPTTRRFTLELNEWNGAVEPRLVLRHAQAPAPAAVVLAGEPEDPVAAALAELAAPLPVAGATSRAAGVPRDRRSGGLAGTLAALVASGEPVLVACADARRRRGHLEGRLGGFAVAAWHALERDPALVARYAHVVALDPPASDTQAALIDERFTVAWGDPEAAVRAAPPTRPATTCARRPPPSTAPCATAPCPTRSPPPRRRPPRAAPCACSTELGLVRVDGARGDACRPRAAPSSTPQRPSAPTPRAWPRAARAWPRRGGRRGRRLVVRSALAALRGVNCIIEGKESAALHRRPSSSGAGEVRRPCSTFSPAW